MKKIKMKPSTPTALEAYAVKLCPPNVRADLCSFGLPMFVRDRPTAINEACVMCNHLNIDLGVARLRFLGRYDNISGTFIALARDECYEQNLAEALSVVNKENVHEEK